MSPLSFCVILCHFLSLWVILSLFESRLNSSNWLKLTQLRQIDPVRKISHILHHFKSLWVTLIHFESFRVRLDLTQTVSKWLKMTQKYYFVLASIMCTFLAHEKIESCGPIDLFVSLVLSWHALIFLFRKQHPWHRRKSSISKTKSFAGSSWGMVWAVWSTCNTVNCTP
jgi:hypothetical protein